MLFEFRSPTLTEDAFPAKNRADVSLTALEILITDAERTHVLDPDALERSAASMALGAPIGHSLISNSPGYRYQEDDVVVFLTQGEIARLATQSLSPAEYLRLRDEFGVFYSISEDHYDLESGSAWPTAMLQKVLAGLGKAPNHA